MTLISISTTIACCLVSAGFGYLTAVVVGRSHRQSTRRISDTAGAPDQGPSEPEKELRLLVDSLYQLTSQVDSQVGEHSLRVNEITDSLESHDEAGSSKVLAAGKLLVSANQKLQADLVEAKSEIQRQREMANACMHESRTDALTNLANRRAFDLEFSRTFAQRRRDGNHFSLLMIDVDHFKRINDRYGHMVGDQLLKGLSRCLTTTLRESDFVARFGGEEFVVILAKTPLEEALKAAERVRSAIAENRFKIGEAEIQITASIGVKEVEGSETESDLLESTDVALYAAKSGGRNRCFFHDGTACLLYVPPVDAETSDDESPTTASPDVGTEVKSVVQPMQSQTTKKVVARENADKDVQL